MSLPLRSSSLLSLASLLLLGLAAAAADFDSAACAENCRFVVVPSLGPVGARGPQGDPGPAGPAGNSSSFDSSATYTGLKLQSPVLSGAISIANAELNGRTNIRAGAVHDRLSVNSDSTVRASWAPGVHPMGFMAGSNAVSGCMLVSVNSGYVGPILVAINMQGASKAEDNSLAFVTLTAANDAAASVATKVFVQQPATAYQFEVRTVGPLPPATYYWHYLVIGTNKAAAAAVPYPHPDLIN